MDPYEHRRRNISLSEDEETILDSFNDFFQKEVPLEVVRAAEPLGFDAELWEKVVGVGLTSMGVPEEAGGDGAGFVDLTLVAEAFGRVLAPVPLLEHIVASRVLAASGDPAVQELLAAAISGEKVLGFAGLPLTGRRVVASAAVARDIVGFDGKNLVVVSASADRPHVKNTSSLPAAWVDPAAESVQVIASSDAAAAFRRAKDEWDVLTASALAGLTQSALEIGAEFTKSRETMGVVIAKLEGISFPLADVFIGIDSSKNLARRAAWFLENEPQSERHLASSALVYAVEKATRGTEISAHVQGGLGFMADANTTLFFLRVKGWGLANADLIEELQHIAEEALAAHRAAPSGVATSALALATA